jgi:hypothetical protein
MWRIDSALAAVGKSKMIDLPMPVDLKRYCVLGFTASAYRKQWQREVQVPIEEIDVVESAQGI